VVDDWSHQSVLLLRLDSLRFAPAGAVAQIGGQRCGQCDVESPSSHTRSPGSPTPLSLFSFSLPSSLPLSRFLSSHCLSAVLFPSSLVSTVSLFASHPVHVAPRVLQFYNRLSLSAVRRNRSQGWLVRESLRGVVRMCVSGN
jgi:hypothetical protein